MVVQVARNRYPNVSFSFETGLSTELARKVYHRQLDAAVLTRANDENAGLRFNVISKEEFVFALPSSSKGMTLSKCIAQMPFIQFLPQSGVGRLLDNYLRRKRIVPKNIIILDSVEAVVECVNAGVGFTALVKEDIMRYGNKNLKLLPMLDPPLIRDLSLVTLRGRQADTYSDALLDLFSIRT
jgi:DNA-binding transcriptional LysR family regulator